MSDTLTLTTDTRGVATLTLNRPEKHNAMSGEMIAEMTEVATRIGQDDAVRVVILTGAGRSFCAGGDLGWMRDQMDADRARRRASAESLARMMGALNSLPKPVIGRVQGNAFGGGVGLCCLCDIVFAVDTATFGLTETKLGLIPATIGPYVVKRMGEGAARQMFMSSRSVDASRAQALGIVSQTCAADDLDRLVEEEVSAYLACSPQAVAQAKALALELANAPNADDVDKSIEALLTRWESQDTRDGLDAFFNKTPPPWA